MKSLLKSIVTKILFVESRFILKKYKPFIIAVTGSVGKTSTKDAIFTAISGHTSVRKSEKSFNSEIGVPLTILGVENAWSDPVAWIKNIFFGLELILFKYPYPKCLIVEVGADHPNDIRRSARLLRPDVAVITKVGTIPVHVEFFPSVEAVLLEKFELPKALKKDGVFIYSNDDEAVRELAKAIEKKVVTFGIENDATVTAKDEKIIYEDNGAMKTPSGISFTISINKIDMEMNLRGVLGRQHIYPIIAALSVAMVKGVPLLDCVKSLQNHIPPRGRMNIINGINGSTLIDDTYNSSPDALHEAVSAIKKIECSGKKILVLGDMMELGQFSKSEHEKIRGAIMGDNFDIVTVGQRARVIARTTKNDKSFESSNLAGEYLKDIVGLGDLVFIKGSQSMRMERVTKMLMLEPDRAGELLVRQDTEWLAKS